MGSSLLEGAVGGAGQPIGIADGGWLATRGAEAVHAAVHVSDLPLDLVVVELEIEVVRGPVTAVEDHELQGVGFVGPAGKIADAIPGDDECLPPIDAAGTPGDLAGESVARIDVAVKGGDDLLLVVDQVLGIVAGLATVKRDIPVGADEQARIGGAEKVDREANRNRPSESIVVASLGSGN